MRHLLQRHHSLPSPQLTIKVRNWLKTNFAFFIKMFIIGRRPTPLTSTKLNHLIWYLIFALIMCNFHVYNWENANIKDLNSWRNLMKFLCIYPPSDQMFTATKLQNDELPTTLSTHAFIWILSFWLSFFFWMNCFAVGYQVSDKSPWASCYQWC